MDTSMEATASLHQSGPNESAASTPPVSAAPAPLATATSFILHFRDQPAYVTGTGTAGNTSATAPPTAVPQAPTTGAGTGSSFWANHTSCRSSLHVPVYHKPTSAHC